MMKEFLTSLAAIGALVSGGTTASAAEPNTADAALAAAQRLSSCSYCDFDFEYGSSQDSARRGLVTIGVSDPNGGGAVMIMGYTGTRWSLLWDGNGSTQNVDRLPRKTVICMDPNGWTNLRKGPGLSYRRVAKVRQPTVKKVFEARLTKAKGSSTPGEAWFRISYNGRPAWVQNLRTMTFWTSAEKNCADWSRYYK